jgi:hypothetical protein
MRLLLGERADMPERSEPAQEADFSMPALPRFSKAGPAFPSACALLVDIAGENRVGFLPLRPHKSWRPDRLFLRPIEEHLPKPLELSAVAGIEEHVIFQPLGRKNQRRSHAARIT